MKRAVLAAAALALAACSVAYSSLAPFPCPTDKQCPGGLSCVFGVGCSVAQADSPCITHATELSSDNSLPDTDCSAVGDGALCSNGRCEVPCGKNNTCGGKRVCSLGSAIPTAGVCLIDCTEKNDCPAGLVCRPLWHDGQKGCFDAKAPAPSACAEFRAELVCGDKFNCGSAFFDNMCDQTASRSYCPTTAMCQAASKGSDCGCPAGSSLATCDGTPCGGTTTCVAPNYGCKKDAPLLKCTDNPSAASGTCFCSDGRAGIAVACGSTMTCEQLCE